jgi:hypothetical protein
MGAYLEMASKLRTPLYQCLALSLVGSLVEKREQYVPRTSKVQGMRKVRQGHEGEYALDEASRETCEGKLNQVDKGHSEAIVMH